MSAPVSGADTRPLFTGDNKDDDAAVIDSFLIETDAPPTPVIERINPTPLHQPKPTTIVRTGTTILPLPAAGWSPIKIVVADAARQELRISGYSTLAAPTYEDYAIIGFDPGITPLSGYRLRHAERANFDDHTGDLYLLINPAATGTFEVSWFAVTQ